MNSEFGKGLCYNLGLFIAHSDSLMSSIEHYKDIGREKMAYEMWFNGAGDHLFEFQPEYAPKHLRKRCEKLKDKVLDFRISVMGNGATAEDVKWTTQEAKDLLRLIDKANGVPVEKGDYE